MTNFAETLELRRQYWATLENLRPLPVNANIGEIHPDVTNFALYLAQSYHRGPQERRVFLPNLLARVYDPTKDQLEKPFVFVIGSGGSTRMVGPSREQILYDIIGWTRDRVLQTRDQALAVRITHRSSIIDADRNIHQATWTNVVDFLVNYYQRADSAFASSLLKVRGQLTTLPYEAIVQQGGEVAKVRERLRTLGVSSRFIGLGRLLYCREYIILPQLFFSAPAMKIQIPSLPDQS